MSYNEQFHLFTTMWENMEACGYCDNAGGAEFLRVWGAYRNAPPGIDLFDFIYAEANRPPVSISDEEWKRWREQGGDIADTVDED